MLTTSKSLMKNKENLFSVAYIAGVLLLGIVISVFTKTEKTEVEVVAQEPEEAIIAAAAEPRSAQIVEVSSPPPSAELPRPIREAFGSSKLSKSGWIYAYFFCITEANPNMPQVERALILRTSLNRYGLLREPLSINDPTVITKTEEIMGRLGCDRILEIGI